MVHLNLNRPTEDGELNDQHDQDLLLKLGGPKYRKRWTLGDSAGLVEGAPQESPWVSAGWLVVPTALALLFLAALLYT